MSICPLCLKETNETQTAIVNGKKILGLCQDCKNCIEMYFHSNSELTINANKKIIERHLSNPDVSTEIKKLLNLSPYNINNNLINAGDIGNGAQNIDSIVNSTNFSKWADIVSGIATATIIIMTVIGMIVGGALCDVSDNDAVTILGVIIGGVLSFIISAISMCIIKMFAEMGRNIAKILLIMYQDR